jgi:hypothetical protein
MSYRGSAKYIASANEFAAFLMSELAEMGWTLHDDISTYEKVYKSNGEGEDRPWLYIRVMNNDLYCYIYWNEVTHTGTAIISVGLSASAGERYVYGNKDLVVAYAGASYGGPIIFGHVPNAVTRSPITTLLDGASAGDGATLHVADSAGFVLGRRYQILGTVGEGRDRVQISEVTDGSHLKVVNLPRNYGSGSFLAPCPQPAIFSNIYGTPYIVNPYDAIALSTTSTGAIFGYGGWCGSTDYFQDQYVLLPLTIYGSYMNLGYASDPFFGIAAGVTSMVPFSLSINSVPITGQATSGAAGAITDTSKSWTINEHANRYIWITGGTGINQIRKIASNTSDTLTLTANWTTNPDSTSLYKISDKVYRYFNNYIAMEETQWP